MAITEVNPHSPVHIELTVTVEEDGVTVPVTAAVVTAVVNRPDGTVLVTDVPMAHVGNGLYRYKLTHDLLTVTGIYTAYMTAAFAGDEARERYQFLVRY